MVFEEIQNHVQKYNQKPNSGVLHVALTSRADLFENDFKAASDLIDQIAADTEESPEDWLVDETEKFCQERALHNAVLESIHIMDGKGKDQKQKGAIPQLLTEALSVSFDPNVGHDYLDDSDKRYEFYHKKQKKIPFDLDFFNQITNGGLPDKTLTVILAGTNVGKSLIMCHFAASALSQHKNVLYITLEMSEEKISQRIDANLMDVTLDDLLALPKEIYERKMNAIKSKVKGKLIVKEYPTACASTAHFRNLLNELNLKRQFKPDIVFVDYINLCTSARVKAGHNVNSYTLIKSIAEELRGLAVEYKFPLVSATQTTRAGFGSSDPGLEDTSESFGLPATADLMFAAIANEEMDKLNQIVIKQLKNRDNDVSKNRRFVIGINKAKMKLYDIKPDQQNLVDSGQEPDEPLNRFGDHESPSIHGPGDRYEKFRTLG